MDNNTIHTKDLLKMIEYKEPVLILDVRDPAKYQTGSLHIENVQNLNIPYVAMRDEEEDVKEQVARLPKDTRIITVCTTGNKAQKAATLLREKGYSAVSLEGGLTAWKQNSDSTLP